MRGMSQPTVGVDTSVLMRLVTAEPTKSHAYCMARLNKLKREGVRVVASNQVIGETYISAHHHYGGALEKIRADLIEVLTGGLVEPQNGPTVLDALSATGGAGLFDRLIADGYAQSGIDTLTLDRAMSRLDQSRLLDPPAAYDTQSDFYPPRSNP